MGTLNDLGMRQKLLLLVTIALVLAGGAASWAVWQLRAQDQAYRRVLYGEAQGAALAEEMRAGLLLQVQALKNTLIRGGDPKQYERFTGEFDARGRELRDLRTRLDALDIHPTAEERELLKKFDTGWAGYQAAWTKAKEAYGGPGGGKVKEADAVMSGKDREAVEAIDGLAMSLLARRDAIGADLTRQAERTLMLTFGTLLAAVAASMGIAFALARSITAPLNQMVQAANGLAVGNLNQDITVRSRDEIGQMAGAFRTMVAFQREMAGVATSMADGDLSRSVQPKSEHDMLGQAFQTMTENLRELIGNVQGSAEGLAETSMHLGAAATQTTDVVQQVNVAMQSLAAGSQDVSHSAMASREAVSDLSRVIDTIASGASAQTQQLRDVSATASQMAADVEHVARNAQSVATASRQARTSAEDGARAVRETVDGMAEIKHVVTAAADKVHELGRLGDRIGAVVETIDDIAEQTNLLALNAAIEAARAGEHGRGFAVVADEVRKLAERSQRETRAISDLIREVQAGTRDAVGAMEQGSEKVAQGSARADEAGAALSEILKAVELTVTQVTQIATAAGEMAGGAHGVVKAMDTITSIVEENSAATEQMAAQAGQVSGSISSIASVSAQSSAATEEVSAASEEMNAQVEEMNAQAEELSATADELRRLVAQFRLSEHAEPARSRGERPDPRTSTRVGGRAAGRGLRAL